ncbi:hypothetical protein EJ08DRAFT_651538 [Tothia fuscella]|uniref:DUF2510 domain-containing protein n=1 Tax=Tothia fuscella TaxID=1048955 RepID=A0A9P4TWM6_9PEZI|nr:hypothetical protein EJ08DRAFT_651538 [Tothia fuscella]
MPNQGNVQVSAAQTTAAATPTATATATGGWEWYAPTGAYRYWNGSRWIYQGE